MSNFKRPKVVAPVLLIILVLVMIVMIIKNMSSPAQGNITQTPPANPEKTDPYAHPGIYKGKYISFSYPAHYKSVPVKLSGSYLEVADYHTIDSSGKQINIGVYHGSAAADSGVAYRRQHKELYKENDSRLGIEFTKSDGTEDTYFIEHNSLIATVSATAPGGGLDGEALFVTSSLKWL